MRWLLCEFWTLSVLRWLPDKDDRDEDNSDHKEAMTSSSSTRSHTKWNLLEDLNHYKKIRRFSMFFPSSYLCWLLFITWVHSECRCKWSGIKIVHQKPMNYDIKPLLGDWERELPDMLQRPYKNPCNLTMMIMSPQKRNNSNDSN